TVNHRRTTNSLSLYVTVRTRGGGLCIIHRDSITAKSHSLQRSLSYSSFECQLVTLHVGGPGSTAGDVTIAVIYRPPPKKSKQPIKTPSSSPTSIASFVDELSDLLVKVGDVIDADQLAMCGDFNCPGVDSTSVRGDLPSLLDAHGLQQVVNASTRRTSNVESLLDLVIGSSSSKRIQQVAVQSTYDVSDHGLVTWSLVTADRPLRQVQSYTVFATSRKSTWNGSKMTFAVPLDTRLHCRRIRRPVGINSHKNT